MKTFVLYFYIFFKAIHPTVKTVGFLAIFFVIRRRHRDEISWIFVFDCVKRCLVKGLKIFRIVKSIQKGSRVRQIPETVSPGSCFLDAISFPDVLKEDLNEITPCLVGAGLADIVVEQVFIRMQSKNPGHEG